MSLRERYRYRMLSERMKGSPMADVYRIIDGVSQPIEGVSDAPRALQFTHDQIEDIRGKQWEHVKTAQAIDGEMQTMSDVRNAVTFSLDKLNKSLGRRQLRQGETVDAFYNEVTGIGTGIDPGVANNASIPISVSPQEATAYYSNGGIAQSIIDKKAKGIFINGYDFYGQDWDKDDLEKLKEHAESLNFEGAVKDWWRDGYVYGGALLVPHLRKDSAITYLMTPDELLREGLLDKDCITRFWEADRWNSVLIPNYNISKSDYLTPQEFMIPITGLSVATERMAIGRPKRLPYWGMLRQMGWGISDFPSFMPSLLAYELTIRAIPIIAQQLNLVYLKVPFDVLIAQSGLNAAKDMQKKNQQSLNEWSMLHPKVLNLVGELAAIDRHFTDFKDLVKLLQQDVGAKSQIPHTILFNEMQSGMDDKSFDITLKQTEVIQQSGKEAAIQLKPVVKMLVCSCFGADSPQAKKADGVSIRFDTPAVPTTEERIDTITAIVNAVNGLVQAGVQLGDAFELVQGQFPQFEISEDIKNRVEAFDDSEQEIDEEHPDKPGFFDSWPFKRKR